MRRVLGPFFVVALILQGSLVSFPLVFLGIVILTVKKAENFVFALAFLLGIILDSLYFKPLGTTSLFFMFFILSLILYRRKFEIDNLTFIFVSSFLGSIVLFLVLNETHVLLKALITSAAALAMSKIWDILEW